MKILSGAELKTLKPELKGALTFYFRQMDTTITHTTRDGAQARIWSLTSSEDMDTLVDALCKLGRLDNVLGKTVAQTVRGLAATNILVEAGAIVTNNAIGTMMHYSRHGLAPLHLGPMLASLFGVDAAAAMAASQQQKAAS